MKFVRDRLVEWNYYPDDANGTPVQVQTEPVGPGTTISDLRRALDKVTIGPWIGTDTHYSAYNADVYIGGFTTGPADNDTITTIGARTDTPATPPASLAWSPTSRFSPDLPVLR